MCLIIWNPYDAVDITEDQLYQAAINNADGFGLGWVADRQPRRFVTVDDFDAFVDHYYQLRAVGYSVLLHFRLATAGNLEPHNTHPFQIGSTILMAHNGVIPGWGDTKFSDTYYMAEFLSAAKGWWRNLKLESILEGFGKFVFVRSRPFDVWIVGEDMGHYDETGNWFSNYSYTTERSRFRWTKEDEEWWAKVLKDGDD